MYFCNGNWIGNRTWIHKLCCDCNWNDRCDLSGINDFRICDSEGNRKTLKITIPENLNYQGAFDDLFEEFTKTRTLERVRTTNLGSLYELTYLVTMKKDADEKKFIDELRCRNGNLNISLCNAEIAKELL